jgi:hypothetical protein
MGVSEVAPTGCQFLVMPLVHLCGFLAFAFWYTLALFFKISTS